MLELSLLQVAVFKSGGEGVETAAAVVFGVLILVALVGLAVAALAARGWRPVRRANTGDTISLAFLASAVALVIAILLGLFWHTSQVITVDPSAGTIVVSREYLFPRTEHISVPIAEIRYIRYSEHLTCDTNGGGCSTSGRVSCVMKDGSTIRLSSGSTSGHRRLAEAISRAVSKPFRAE